MKKYFSKGDTGTYIHDHGPWSYVCDIPFDVAILWLEKTKECWGIDLGCGKPLYQCENVQTDWMNKLWVIIEDEAKEIALYNHDGVIKVYEK